MTNLTEVRLQPRQLLMLLLAAVVFVLVWRIANRAVDYASARFRPVAMATGATSTGQHPALAAVMN